MEDELYRNSDFDGDADVDDEGGRADVTADGGEDEDNGQN